MASKLQIGYWDVNEAATTGINRSKIRHATGAERRRHGAMDAADLVKCQGRLVIMGPAFAWA